MNANKIEYKLDKAHEGIFEVAGGNPPDIAVESYGWPITYSQMGILQPVDDVIEAIGEENILPQDLKLNYYDGHYWGVPLYGTPSVLYYRKDIFEEKGLTPPRPGMN